jgi:hypothetical protein
MPSFFLWTFYPSSHVLSCLSSFLCSAHGSPSAPARGTSPTTVSPGASSVPPLSLPRPSSGAPPAWPPSWRAAGPLHYRHCGCPRARRWPPLACVAAPCALATSALAAPGAPTASAPTAATAPSHPMAVGGSEAGRGLLELELEPPLPPSDTPSPSCGRLKMTSTSESHMPGAFLLI